VAEPAYGQDAAAQRCADESSALHVLSRPLGVGLARVWRAGETPALAP